MTVSLSKSATPTPSLTTLTVGGVEHQAGTETEYGEKNVRRTPLKRTKGLNKVSSKRRKETPVRRVLVEQHLSLTPYCEATLIGLGCSIIASDVHEIVPRGRRPGAHLDPELFVSLCRKCHSWVTTHPDWSERHGLMLGATAGGADVAVAKSIRSRLECDVAPSQRHLCTKDHRDK